MSPRIKSSTRNYVLFIIMSVLAALEVASGFILWLILPSGGGYMGGRGLLTN